MYHKHLYQLYINTEGLDDPNLGIQSGYEERLIKIKDTKGSFVGGLLSGELQKQLHNSLPVKH